MKEGGINGSKVVRGRRGEFLERRQGGRRAVICREFDVDQIDIRTSEVGDGGLRFEQADGCIKETLPN